MLWGIPTLSAQSKSPRVLYWLAVSGEEERAFLARWAAVELECRERDLELRRVETTADRFRLRLSPEKSQVVLVGRDGLMKGYWPLEVAPQKIFYAIDQMPLRQKEIESRRGSLESVVPNLRRLFNAMEAKRFPR